MKNSLLATAAVVISLTTGFAAPTYFAGTGHWYEALLAGSPTGINWSTASATAIAMGGHLATISNGAENAFVHSLVASDSAYWLTDGAGNTEGAWLGGIQWTEGSGAPWSWVNGDAFGFTNWAGGEPNNWAGAEDAMVFFGHGVANYAPTWNDVNQGFGAKGYVVEFESNPNAVPETPWVAMLVLTGLAAVAGFCRGIPCVAR
jgi:hypothetical protein